MRKFSKQNIKVRFIIQLMHIGYQGIKNSYSHQVCTKYLDMKKLNSDDLIGFKSFELVFKSLLFGLLDLAVLPIENSIGGCIFVNYDLFFKYNIKIHCEFHHNIEHSLYGLGNDTSKIKKVISHPQALQQCKENLRKNNFEHEEYWDTTASIKKIIELNDETIGCIAPPNLEKDYGVNELKTKFNDQKNNITRFYLISLKDKKINLNFILKNKLNESKLINIYDKFSGYIIIKDKIGSLQSYLNKFKQNNINLTKIESRPYLGDDRIDKDNPFSYIFYIEGIYNLGLESMIRINDSNDTDIDSNNLTDSAPFNYFGKFSLKDFELSSELSNFKENSNVCFASKSTSLVPKINIGIVGFGRFGQFIAKKMIKYGFNVYATSRSDYSEESKKIGANFINMDKFSDYLENESNKIVIISTSINSFGEVLNNIFKTNVKGKIIIDVLSVKNYPYKILTDKKLNDNNLLLLTHPMFGPDSAKDTWIGKKFVYWYNYQNLKIIDKDNELVEILELFLNFWKDQGCEMINIDPSDHDLLSADSQFLSHFIGRLLELFNCEETIIDTDLYSNLLKVKNFAVNDSWDLFDGLYKYNDKSKETIRKIKFSLFDLIEKLDSENSIVKESSTGRTFSMIKELRKNGVDILNLAIGEPSWYPEIFNTEINKNLICDSEGISEYSTSKGETKLIDKIVEVYKKKSLITDLSFNNNNVMITAGAKFGLYLVLKHLTKSGGKWIIPKPYWVSYPDIVDSLDGESIFVESNVSNNWEPDIDELWKMNKGSYKENNNIGIILCYPNNPTGLCYSDKFINSLINLVKKKNLYLIVDEVYLMINGNVKSLFNRFSELGDKIIVVSSFSKYYAIPGWRVGYIFAEQNLIKNLSRLQSSILGCSSKAGQEVAYKLLEIDYNPNLLYLKVSKEKIEKKLINNGWLIGKSSDPNQNQMYIFPYHNDKLVVEDLVNKLKSNNIFIMEGASFGIENAVRILLPSNKDDLDKIIQFC